MKLAFITGSLVHGGAERHAITLANRFAERGHECHLAYVKNEPTQLERVHLVAPSSVRCLQATRYLDLGAVGRLRSLLAELAPDAILATNPYALLYASLARRRTPVVVALHSTYTRTVKEALQMAAYRPLFWAARAAVFVCERQRRHWLARGLAARSNHVIYNGIDLAHWQPLPAEHLRRALGFAEDDYVIGLSAVLRPEKNPVQLVAATAALLARGIPARAFFIGDGPERPAVEATAKALGIAERVSVSGFQQDVRPFLAACDVLALTSFTEAFSLAAIEAMALERPVVHAEVGGAAEMIQSGHDGWLFPVGDTATLVERLAALADPVARRRMGENARATVERRFAEGVMVERYEALLAEITVRRKSEPLRKRAPAH